ncbi:MAG: AAA family ATPase [Opitutaceae bacterium]|nr:AAA family ATPase [Opitutaceae bacterium]
MKRFRRGLVVGKFAPLHRGHEQVVRRAEAECVEVVLLSYSKPELAGCGPERRAEWLTRLFPAARVIVLAEPATSLPANDADDLTHRRFVGRVIVQRVGGPVDAVFTSEAYGDGFAEELTRCFREIFGAGVPSVVHVEVDRVRRLVPVSGTQLRTDVHAQRAWLDPRVYATFVARVALLGGESSGKSTLAARLATEHGTAYVAEYGRDVWAAKSGRLERDDLRAIAEEQVAREEKAAERAVRFLFCDTTPLTTRFYAEELFGAVDPAVERLAGRPYAHVFLCAPDFPFVQDGTRSDAAFRQRQHAWYESELARRGVPYDVLTGTVEERCARVRAVLTRLLQEFDQR